ncbi:hypothetical protein OKW22_000909 [Bacilli bacterium PM5-3]|nr:hypothetical protein [Bacilli bacterium PM5-3]
MLQKYDISLKDEIESHVLQLDYKDHNLSFTNMYLWRNMYKLSVHISKEFIIVFCELNGEFFSLNPICVIENVKGAVKFLLKYFEDNNLPFIIHNCVKKVKDEIEAEYGDFFTYELARDSFDYLYSVEKMMTYSGKKLQKKRNHVNNFLKEYQDRYELKIIEGNPDVVKDCIEFTKKWDSNKSERDMYIDQEVSGTIDVLNHMSQLSCEGLAIYLDGEIQGFGIGTQLNDTTAVINVEKADGSIVGLYPFLRQQVVKTFFDDLKYINTEDDVGEENLRKSKLSYRPEYLVEKYTVRRKDEV